jgi:hypothetical protein
MVRVRARFKASVRIRVKPSASTLVGLWIGP